MNGVTCSTIRRAAELDRHQMVPNVDIDLPGHGRCQRREHCRFVDQPVDPPVVLDDGGHQTANVGRAAYIENVGKRALSCEFGTQLSCQKCAGDDVSTSARVPSLASPWAQILPIPCDPSRYDHRALSQSTRVASSCSSRW